MGKFYINFIKNMIYKDSVCLNVTYVIAEGTYMGIPFKIINNTGCYPVAYIQVKEEKEYGLDYDSYNYRCHGGLTFACYESKLLPYEKGKVWLGWDYSHYGDFVSYGPGGKKWTTIEILNQVIDAIDFYIEHPNKPKQPIVEFINYTGKYPNLCSGDLTLRINGIEYIFSSRYKNTLNIDLLPSFWSPGGEIERDSNGKYSIKEKGDWEFVNERLFKEEILKYKDEIMKVFNENVPKGCCGGCF